MTPLEGLLLAVIAILVIMVLRNLFGRSRAGVVRLAPKPASCGAIAEIDKPKARAKSDKQSHEKEIDDKLKENQEWFSVCGGDSNVSKQMMDCVCGDDPDVNFAKFDYGAPNMDYKDYVASQAIDDKVIENHAQFVRDRKGLGPEGEFITGRTYSPDSHDSYDPIPWIGIRGRPQYVQQCNPTQVPDVDTNLYKGNRPFCFWT